MRTRKQFNVERYLRFDKDKQLTFDEWMLKLDNISLQFGFSREDREDLQQIYLAAKWQARNKTTIYRDKQINRAITRIETGC